MENRQRPYRGLTKDGEWVYGWLVTGLWFHTKDRKPVFEIVRVPNDSDYDCWSDVAENSIVEVLPETVGQSTGLKDKNGEEAEIYKGDLLGSRYFSAILEVDQITEGMNSGQWIAKQNDGGYQDLFEALTCDGYEIIGNIHQVEADNG